MQADSNPDKILKPGMFTSTTVVLLDAGGHPIPETAVDYTSAIRLPDLEKKEEDGASLTRVRTFVQTGNRIEDAPRFLWA